MGELWENFHRRRNRAEKLYKEVEFKETEHWAKGSPNYEGFKCYDVLLKGEVIGQALQAREHIYRKAGRLISMSRHRTAWQFQTPHKPGWTLPSGLYYRSRKKAVEEMLDHLLHRGDLK